jgi:hypothetical protein
MKTQTVEAEVLEVRAYMTSKSYTAKVYIPIEGCLSMDKMYFNGNTKTEAKQKARTALKVKGFTIKFV